MARFSSRRLRGAAFAPTVKRAARNGGRNGAEGLVDSTIIMADQWHAELRFSAGLPTFMTATGC